MLTPTRMSAVEMARETAEDCPPDGYGIVKEFMQDLDGAVLTGDRDGIVKVFTWMLAVADELEPHERTGFYAACAAWAAFYIVDTSNAWGTKPGGPVTGNAIVGY